MKSSDQQIFVYGAGGHGRVVADILRSCGVYIHGFVDDNPEKDLTLPGIHIAGDGKWLADYAATASVAVALGIGDNFARKTVVDRCAQAGIVLVNAIHPSAIVSSSASLSDGIVIMPQAVLNADSVVGQGAIINTSAVVEHDCEIGAFAHLSPKSALGGNVHVGDFSWLGMGSCVIPDTRIGIGAIVGAGAIVLRDVNDWTVVAGVPARTLRILDRRF